MKKFEFFVKKNFLDWTYLWSTYQVWILHESQGSLDYCLKNSKWRRILPLIDLQKLYQEAPMALKFFSQKIELLLTLSGWSGPNNWALCIISVNLFCVWSDVYEISILINMDQIVERVWISIEKYLTFGLTW